MLSFRKKLCLVLEMTEKKIIIYTDGACIGNPGPGGYGAVILDGTKRTQISGGFQATTNNRMELLAIIESLKLMKGKSRVMVNTDSKYIVNAVQKGWLEKWAANRWMRNKRDKAENADLWKQMVRLLEKHEVHLKWVKGHAGNIENEVCDRLASAAARGKGLKVDKGFEGRAKQRELF
jgi:ribonuclease HI